MANTPTGPQHHETRALLRAHLAAASGYRHATRHCPICHRLLRLAMESGPPEVAGDLAPSFTADFATDGLPAVDVPAVDVPAVDLPDAEAAKDAIPAAGSAGK